MEIHDICDVGVTIPRTWLLSLTREGRKDWECMFFFRTRISLPDRRIIEIDDVARVRGKQRGRKPRHRTLPPPPSA